MKGLNHIEAKLLEDFLTGSKEASLLKNVGIGVLVRLLRKRIYLTQRQLAKRAGVPQSTIGRIETGKLQPTEGLLRKIFDAMECDFVLAPLPRQQPDEIIRARARQVAEKRIRYLEGTMALEDQAPDKEWLETMIEEEMEDLLRSPSQLWNENGESNRD